MGNYLACSLTPKMSSNQSTRVIFPTGEVRLFREPTNAAEPMLECPNFFIVNSKSLHIGRRFAALSADEDLEVGNVYLMVRMKRVNSVVTAADMAALFMAASSASKRLVGRVSPAEENGGVGVEEEKVEGGKEKSFEEFQGLKVNFEDFEGLRERISVGRSRKPELETIREEPMI